ncbi:putative fluoride ion transporter CrcB 2 [Sporosarcina sp. NCCP-2716]|uniref:fluoride efflux transporter FluC n=1 Tax=Sporosarcina sp. NCCP-2716 TaxID=2943679 RepID=UPI002040173F|nr:CrcB family protein [Sporosarcina sp. NCCP-2716]GKV69437.1 putative fluoride ion transporter CrcB 2 [Sporosarcina sp. NCCP-2716]
MTVIDVAAVAAGGFLGALIRYGLSRRLNGGDQFPLGTLFANLAGCFLIGFVFALGLPAAAICFLVSGLAGSLTTFSTWMKEVLSMARGTAWLKAALYLAGSAAAGLLFVWIGNSAGGLFG